MILPHLDISRGNIVNTFNTKKLAGNILQSFIDEYSIDGRSNHNNAENKTNILFGLSMGDRRYFALSGKGRRFSGREDLKINMQHRTTLREKLPFVSNTDSRFSDSNS